MAKEVGGPDMGNEFMKKITFPTYGDDRGILAVIEGLKDIPFEIKRIFYIYNVKDDKSRGNHANTRSQFVMVALAGKVKVKATDGFSTEEVVLNNPGEGLYLANMTWKEMHEFSEDCVLLVISSEVYDKSEYINDYKEFKESAVAYVKK